MEFRHLRYFISVAEEGNFSRAAEKMNIAQPSLAQQIGNLEKELGFSLFNRARRQLQLTPAGQLYLEWAYRILNQVEQTKAEAKKVSRGEIGKLTIGYVNFAFYTVVLEILKEFSRRFPQVELVLKEMLTVEQLEGLNTVKIDVGIAILPSRDDSLTEEIITPQRYVVILPENHRLVDQPLIHLADLANDPFILFPHKIKSPYYNKVVELCREAGFTPKVSQEIIQMPGLVKMVAAGMGVSLVIDCIKEARIDGVVFKELDHTSYIDLGMVWRKTDVSPVVQAFLEVAREVRDLAAPVTV